MLLTECFKVTCLGVDSLQIFRECIFSTKAIISDIQMKDENDLSVISDIMKKRIIREVREEEREKVKGKGKNRKRFYS